MNKFFRNIFSLAINATIVGILIYVIVIYLGTSTKGEIHGGEVFKYYTTLSNVICAISCAIAIPFNILTIIKKENKTPVWVNIMKLYTTTTVGVTFLVVICFLAPLSEPDGFKTMYSGTMLYLHLIVPILAIVNYICFDLYNEFDFKFLYFNFIPTIIYAIFYIVYVKGFNGPDFYMFFSVGGIWAAVGILFGILAIAFGFGVGLRALYKLRNRNH